MTIQSYSWHASPIVALALLACTPTPQPQTDSGGTTESGESSSSGADTTDTTDTTTETESETSADTPDMPGDPEGCDVWMQDCPDGHKCVPADEEFAVYECVPVVGDQAPGEPCVYDFEAELDDCDASSICLTAAFVGDLCFEQCTGSLEAPMCPQGQVCRISGPIVICTDACDPIGQDCDEGFGCFWFDSQFSCIPTTENIPTGEPCSFPNDCAPGLLCVDGTTLPSCAGAECCTAYCDLSMGVMGCVNQPGTACVAFLEDGVAPAGYENLGICVVAP